MNNIAPKRPDAALIEPIELTEAELDAVSGGNPFNFDNNGGKGSGIGYGGGNGNDKGNGAFENNVNGHY